MLAAAASQTPSSVSSKSQLSHSQITNTTSPTMSWQSYVDDQLLSTKVIKNAVIAGHDGNIWATSAGFNVSLDSSIKIATPQKRANFRRIRGQGKNKDINVSAGRHLRGLSDN